jgi:excisionase family DNA binding protein
VPTHLYTVDQVAERLTLHAKTVRRYIREGRLKAKRIGKEYRVSRLDLDAFAGVADPDPVVRTRQVTVSSIVDVDAISPDDSHRVTTMLMAALNSRKGEGDYPRVDTIYYEERGRLRVTITADAAVTCDLIRLIDTLTGKARDQHL